MTRYISTRGEAPALGFCDVMLAGLARDGGLYVPETWPQLVAGNHRGVFRPALLGSRGRGDPPVRRRRNRRRGSRPHGQRGLCHLPPSGGGAADQIGPNQFVLELFHGPTLAFKDVAMQLISRLMDHVLAKRAQRTTIVVATSGDTGGAAVDAFAGLDNVDLIVLFPHGRISDVQRRMMTTSGAGNVHALAVEGTFDDCQAIVKGLFNHHGFRDAVSLSGVNSINWARIVAQVVYYFTSAVALGAPSRQVDFTVPTGNFGDIFAGYVAKRMGLPVRWLRIAANINDILPRTLKTGIYEVREVHATASPSMDIQVSSNFERLLFEASGRDAAHDSPADGIAEAVRTFRAARRGAGGDIREEFDAGRADETETSAAIRAAWREAGDLVDPHTAVALAVADRDTSDSESSQHRAVDRACREISRRGRGRLRRASAIAGLARGPDDEARTYQGHEERSGGNRAVREVGQPRRQARSCRMSVDVTKLPSGLTVITDTMPHLETAALGVWAGVGGRDEKPNEHGISHLLEHMAFKGTARRSSREIVEEIEAVGGDLNAGTSTETTAYYARVMKADVPLALDVLSDILANPSFVPDELEREKSVIVQEIGAAQDTPDDVVFEHLNDCVSGPADGSLVAGNGEDPEGVQPRYAARLSFDALSRARHGGGGRRRRRSQAGGRRKSSSGSPASTARRRRNRNRRCSAGRLRVVHRELEQAHLTLALRACRNTDCRCSACRSSPTRSAAGCRRGCSRKCAKSAGCATRSTPFMRPIATPAFSGSTPAPTPATRRR